MSKWLFKGKPLKEVPEGAYGFTYKVTINIRQLQASYYIGRKCFESRRNTKISKKRAEELYSGRGARKKKELKICESDWKSYCTSSTSFKKLILDQGEDNFKWEILNIYYSKTELEFAEAREIIDSMCDSLCENQWLKLQIYKKNLDCNKNS